VTTTVSPSSHVRSDIVSPSWNARPLDARQRYSGLPVGPQHCCAAEPARVSAFAEKSFLSLFQNSPEVPLAVQDSHDFKILRSGVIDNLVGADRPKKDS